MAVSQYVQSFLVYVPTPSQAKAATDAYIAGDGDCTHELQLITDFIGNNPGARTYKAAMNEATAVQVIEALKTKGWNPTYTSGLLSLSW